MCGRLKLLRLERDGVGVGGKDWTNRNGEMMAMRRGENKPNYEGVFD
jgi:hypothetical protein